MFSWVDYHHYNAGKIKLENKANIYSNNNSKLPPVKIGEKKLNNKSLDLDYNCEIKKNSPVLIYSGSQKIIINDNNKKYMQNYSPNPLGSIIVLKNILHKNISSKFPFLNNITQKRNINHHNGIYKIYSSFLNKPQIKNNIIKYKGYNNNYYLKNIQRYDKIDRPTINIGKNYINNCQI